MVKLTKFDIVLAKSVSVYCAGDTVDGELLVNLDRAMKMKGITVKCRGCSEVFWTENCENPEGDITTHHATEEYMDKTLTLLEGAQTDEPVELQTGNHVFPFKFVLPDKIPASFESGCRCYVRYWVKGVIEKPWKTNKEIKRAFTVYAMLDLNKESKAKSNVSKEGIKTIGSWCCETGPVYGKLWLSRAGYVPGEHMSCNAEITDGTGHGVVWSKIRLMLKATYHASKRNKTTEWKQISVLQHGPINPGNDDEYDGEKILVPPLPPSHLKGCSLIDISYHVELLINVKDLETDLKIRTDVIIGTVPIQSVVQKLLKATVKKRNPKKRNQRAITKQPGRQEQPDGQESQQNVSWPPSYRETVFGQAGILADDDNENITGKLNFAPRYIYYDWIEKRQLEIEQQASNDSDN